MPLETVTVYCQQSDGTALLAVNLHGRQYAFKLGQCQSVNYTLGPLDGTAETETQAALDLARFAAQDLGLSAKDVEPLNS